MPEQYNIGRCKMPTFDWSFDLSSLVTAGLKIILILIITVVVIYVMKRAIRKLVHMRIPKIREETEDELASRADTLARVINKTLAVVVWIIGISMILSVLGINVTAALGAIGVASLAIGFAAQNIIRDYLHGFFIVMEDWYRIGEVATVAGITGVVDKVNLRRTVLRDINGTMHIVPNSKIELTSNMTREWSRINLDISVGYGEDLDKCINVINAVCQELKDDPKWNQDLLSTPAALRVNSLGDSGISIKILGDTKPMKQWALMGELRKRLKTRFDVEGIEIPWPITKVYFGNEPASKKFA